MLQKRLIALLLLLILLPTFATGWMAYRFAIDDILGNRLDAVSRVAESRLEQLVMVLRRANSHTNAALADLLAECMVQDRLNRDCAMRSVNDFLHREGAAGAWLFRSDRTDTLAIGNPPLPIADFAHFGRDQLAGLIPSLPDRSGYFYTIAGDPGQPWQLAVFYQEAPIQAIFGPHAVIGRSGESLLADRQGIFVTPARFPPPPNQAQATANSPLAACLAGENGQGQNPDYRGRAVIYSYRHVAEIGGGCILAQIEQDEAFSAIQSLKHNMLLVVTAFIVLTGFTSQALAKRIVAPIARLTLTARRIRDGDFSLRAEVSGHDEIAELASSFNHMTDALADAQHNLETKIAERTLALRTSEERYILAERAVNDGIWDWNILTHEYYLSPRWNKILGYAAGELPNEEAIFFELIHPDDKARASDAFARHLERNERYSTELRLRHRDGSYRWVLDRGEALRDANGRPVRMVGSITDITERKAAEAELLEYREHLEELVAMATTEVKAIVQTAVNGVISIDSSGIIRMFNPAAEKLFGWRSDEIVGKNVSLLMPEPDASAHDGYIRRFLAQRQSRILGTEREVIAQRKDGSRFPASLAVGHGIISEGRHIFVGFISDITLQKQAELELRQAKEAAEAAAKAKANFLANMSHEIRTPMNTVIGFAEVALQDANLSNATRNHIKTILSSGRHLLSVINDILDFSKIEAGKIELESVCFNLPVAIQEALQIMSLRAAEKGLRIDLAVEAGLPHLFVGDPNRLRQIILNLVGNSVKFTDTGYIAVSIGRAEQPELLHFAIADTGIGMSPEQTERIFESFSQADATTSRRFGGTGLGTTISKQIVEMMGGRIWVESQLGVGSVFHFTVRLPEAAANDVCLYESAAPRKRAYYSPRRFKILLAEDVEANAKLASLRLEQQGHRVRWVKNGAEAVAAYHESDFDLILMDLQMPVLDGIQATRQIRELEQGSLRRIPILALTASVLSHERRESLAAGIDAIVGKPIDIDELLAQMENLTPPGFGIANNGGAPAPTNETAVDFAPLADVADYRKGLSNWLDPLIYADALLNFAAQHAADADNIQLSLANGDIEAAKRSAHALKGVAGNLALVDIAALAANIDAELKNGTPALAAAQIDRLRSALDQAAAAVRRLELPEKQPVASAEAFDAAHIADLLQQLLRNLDTLNPEKVEPVLQELAPYLTATELQAIRYELDSFDFDGAKAAVGRLQAKLAGAAEGEQA
ncbi:PAS domain S-box protein [Methylomonas sp. EFPC3]|uniref:PAS domain S-box protein n=1 Tax=Methylomonas sp. EFPC3 TaxID=3021710 RepID=UPI002417D3B4|nr:PAS domain S-box protein [Methylomonas sp. EFPC3]WFP51190.1 PAS domain S-box protein [Methylomonas sp. EFPC3]